MTTSQRQLYFREWNKARKVLRQAGFSATEADEERLRIHDENGLPESSKDFNKTTHLDLFIKACRTICGASHIDIQDQERKRLVYTIEKLGLDDPYLDHLARCKKEGSNWRALPSEKLRHLLYTAKNRARSKSMNDQSEARDQ